MNGDTGIADVCRREGVVPNLLHHWRKQLMGAAEAEPDAPDTWASLKKLTP